jgi:3-oxoacyl-[acyl-carrier protein] reductase
MATRHALITGASRGIGRVTAQALASRGCRVALHYHRNRAAAEDALAQLAPGEHAVFKADLADPSSAKDLWRDVMAAFGRIDILINNAGIYADHPPLGTGWSDWHAAWMSTLATNLVAPAHLSYLAAQAMNELPADPVFGRGRIVNITSRGAFRGEPDAPSYGASKAGLNSLSQSLAKALAPKSIYVFAVAPGWVETDMAAEYLQGPRGAEIMAQHPLGRVATADEIARTVAFCALDAPAAMTGSIIDVNGASYLRT